MYRAKDTGVTPKNMNSWVKAGIVDENRKKKTEWRRFSHSQLMWINIIKELKSFGMHDKTILRTKKSLDVIDLKETYLNDKKSFLLITPRGIVIIAAGKRNHQLIKDTAEYSLKSYIRINLSKVYDTKRSN